MKLTDDEFWVYAATHDPVLSMIRLFVQEIGPAPMNEIADWIGVSRYTVARAIGRGSRNVAPLRSRKSPIDARVRTVYMQGKARS